MTWDCASGYHTEVDYPALMLLLLKRASFWLTWQWRCVDDDIAGGEDAEALQGLVNLDKEG